MPRSNSKPPLYFVNAPVDFLFIGGLSIAAYALLGMSEAWIAYDSVLNFSLILLWIGNWPHFAASNYRLYSDPNNIRQYPITALVVPVLAIVAVVGAFLSPENVAPYLIKLFLLWSPYHFSGQTLGITLLYARRAGVQFNTFERRALVGFLFFSFLLPNWQNDASGSYYGVQYPALGIPNWFGYAAQIAIFLCGGLLAMRFLKRHAENKERIPWIVLLPAVTQYVWFVMGPTNRHFYMLVPFFHSIQYLFIAWMLQLKLKKDSLRIAPSGRYVATESARWGAVNVAGGIALFYLFPRFCSYFGFPLDFATGVAIVGVQLHHFFVDGVIWKLRNPAVASPLMVNFSELVAPVRRRAIRRAA